MGARTGLVALGLGLAATAAAAVELKIQLPGNDPAQRLSVRYSCGPKGPLAVTYINLPPNSLAVLPVNGQPLIFSSVLSGSGARYASGPYVWWTKGRHGSLTDERQPNGPSLLECDEAG